MTTINVRAGVLFGGIKTAEPRVIGSIRFVDDAAAQAFTKAANIHGVTFDRTAELTQLDLDTTSHKAIHEAGEKLKQAADETAALRARVAELEAALDGKAKAKAKAGDKKSDA